MLLRQSWWTPHLPSVDWFFDVCGQDQATYLFCSELVESVHGGAQESALGGCEACASLLAGYIGLWTGLQAG